MRRLIALLLVVLVPQGAVAQDVLQRRIVTLREVPTVPAIPPGSDEIAPLARGDRAPFDGMLLSIDTAIRWTNALRWWPETFRLRVTEMGELMTVLEANHQIQMRIVEESYQREILGLRGNLRQTADRLARALSRPFYDTMAFGMVVGAVVVLLLGGLSAGVAFAALN